MLEPWRRKSPTRRLHEGWRTVIEKTFVRNDGAEVIVETVDEEGAQVAAVIAVTKDRKVVIARQFRCGPERIFDELPAGNVDENETPLQAARRELAEEVGYTSENFNLIGEGYKNAYGNTTWHYFLALDCVETGEGQKVDEFEEITVKIISIAELISNAKTAQMTDAEAVWLAYDTLRELEDDNEKTN